MPILGVVASQISGHLVAPYSPTGSYDALAVYTVPSGGASSITFAGIPQSGYQHLQLRVLTRSDRSAANSNIYMGFNGDTTTGNYYGHYLSGDGTSAGAGAKIGSTTAAAIISAADTSTANVFTGAVIDILDYTNTNKNKVFRSLNGYDTNGDGRIFFMSGLWINTNAINSIQITDALGNFKQYSQFALYGIRG